MTQRILEIIPTLDRSGAEKQLTLLASQLPRDAFDVHVAVLTRTGPLQADLDAAGVPVALIDKRRKLDPAAFWRLKALIRKLKPDLVHTWIFAANAYGRMAALQCGVRCVVGGERCVDPWKTWVELSIDRYLAKRSACIVANSGGIRDFYVRKGLPAEKFEIIPNGIAAAPPCSTTREQIVAELGLPEHARLIGLIGRLWPQKRVKDAIWAADLLKVIRDDVHLLVFGDGPQRASLERFSEQCVIADKVHFLGHRNDVARFAPHFDILWSPSAYEGQSNAIMEAMAWGVPVIATNIPGSNELVTPDETGYLISAQGWPASATTVNKTLAASLAQRTLRLLDNAELARQFGDAGRRRVLQEFSVEKMVERHADLYRRLLG
jgi:glycosyltransferase involved in cell wall biosynthesis